MSNACRRSSRAASVAKAVAPEGTPAAASSLHEFTGILIPRPRGTGTAGERHPIAQAIDSAAEFHPLAMLPLDLGRRLRAAANEAQHLGISAEVMLRGKMTVGQRDEQHPLGNEHRLRHAPIIDPKTRHTRIGHRDRHIDLWV